MNDARGKRSSTQEKLLSVSVTGETEKTATALNGGVPPSF